METVKESAEPIYTFPALVGSAGSRRSQQSYNRGVISPPK